jgi:tol-pal system protein YbgF
MEAFRGGELGQAVLDFEELVERHPAHPLAGSARFWIGEAYFRTREFQQAAVEYQKAIDGSPGSDKVPEALLKLGLAQRALRREDRAREAWSRLIRDFPDSRGRSEGPVSATGATSREVGPGDRR